MTQPPLPPGFRVVGQAAPQPQAEGPLSPIKPIVPPPPPPGFKVVGQQAQPNFFANAARGMAERGADLMGGLIDAGVGIAEALPDWAQAGVVYDDQGLRFVTGDEYRQAPSVAGDLADTLRSNNAGYVPQGTWENVKGANGIIDTLAEAGKFAVEQGIVSLPDMFMAASPAGLPTYMTMRSGELARDRATAHGRDEVSVTDLSMAVPTAAAVSALEKIGAMGILNPGTAGMGALKGGAVGALAAGTREGLTEAPQEALEYLTTTPQDKLSWREAGERSLAGAVAGAGYGGPLGAVSGAVQGTQPGPNQPPAPTDQQKLDIVRAIQALAPAYEQQADPTQIDPAAIAAGNERLRGGYDQIAELFQRTGTSPSPGVAVEQTTLDEVEGQPAQEPPPPVRLNDQLADMAARITELRNRPAMNIEVDEQGPKVTEIEAAPAPDARLNEPFPPAPPKKGTKVEDIGSLLEEIELAPPPQEQTLAPPPPAMPVDSRGVAATPAMQQSLEQRAAQAERAGNVEGAMAMRRDALTPDLRPQPATDGIEAAFQPAEEIEALPAPDGTRLSRAVPNEQGAPVRRGPDVGRLQQAFEGLTSSLKGAAPVRVVATKSELPAHILAKMEAEQAEEVGGIYDNGTVYMVADELPNPVRAARTFFHEQVGHGGLRGLFDIANSPEGKRAFDKLLDDIVAAGRAGKFELYESEFATPQEAAEEYIARSSERGARDPAGIMPRVRVMVAQALRKTPVLGRYFKNITQAEIDALLARARRYTEEGGSETQAFRGSRFARGLPGDTRFARKVGTQRLGHDEILKNADGSWRRNASGDISGAPPGIKTDADINAITQRVLGYMEHPSAQMPESGQWYERSGKEIRRLAKHSRDMMEKVVRTMARFSVSAQVGANTTFSVKAAYQLANGQEVKSGRFPNVFAREAGRLLTDKNITLDTPGVNRKVLNFYRNLWDATFNSDKYENAATMDMWMARLYGYPGDSFTDAQYRFANYLTQQVTRAYNAKHGTSLKPRMAQAALWTYARAAGLDDGADADFDAKYDFQSYLQRAEQNVTWEAVPSASLPGAGLLVNAPRDVRDRYTKEVVAVTVKGGKDLLMDALRSPLYSTERGRGAFEGAVNNNMVSTLAALKPDGYDRSLADLYAIATLYVHSQDAVPWFQLDPKATNADKGVALEFGKAPTQRDMEALERALRSKLGNAGFTQAGNRVFIIDFGKAGKGYNKFVAAVEAALDALPSLISGKISKVTASVKATGEYHDVKGITGTGWDSPAAAREGLRREISRRGRPDLLDRLDGWRESVEGIRSRYLAELGGDAGPRLSRRVGGGRDSGRSYPPLEGGPVVEGATGPDPRVVEVAERYAREAGIPLRRQSEYARVDPARARRIAAAYEAMPHAPNDPKVKEAYDNLIRQTVAQYRALERAGFKFWFYDKSNDPYAGNPWNAMRDLRKTQTMGVYATEDGFGTGEVAPDDNAMLVDTGITWPYGSLDGKPKRVLANDLFRAVHDAFGHGMEGAGFRDHGEENAWQAHVRLFTGSAVAAITSETRGQNSWLNYGPHGEANQTARVEDTVFSEQKTGLMPEWTWTEGRVGDSDTRFSRRINKLGLYSALEDQFTNRVPMKAAPVDGWKGVLKGLIAQGKVKADEVEWSGVSEWLDLQKGKVTRDQIVEYLKQGGVQVEETTLGGPRALPEILSDYFANTTIRQPTTTQGWIEEAARQERKARQFQASGNEKLARRSFDLAEAMSEYAESGETGALATKYNNYTLPGGDNYREVLLTLPIDKEKYARSLIDPAVWDRMDESQRAQFMAAPVRGDGVRTYKSSHWDEPNVLAHIRTKDRADADGKRVLFVEEIQSDWAQEGRKKGFKGELRKGLRIAEQEPGFFLLLQEGNSMPVAHGSREDVMRAAENYGLMAGTTPRAPFVEKTESWLTLALKRIITMAVQEGHDRVAFVTGAQSADRYDLSREVGGVYYMQDGVGRGTLIATERGKTISNSTRPVFEKDNVSPEDIETYVGKEAAEKLMQQEPDEDGFRGITGDGLKLGGTGMRSFYDKIVPGALKKLLPKLGGKLGASTIELPSNVSERDRGAFQIAQDINTPFEGEVTLRRRMPDGEVVTIGVMSREEAYAYTENPDNYTGQPSPHLAFDITLEMREKVAQGVPLFSRKLPTKSGAQPTMMDTWREKVGEPAWNKITNAVTPLLSMVKLADTVPVEFKRQMREYRAEMQREARSIQGVAERSAALSPAERNMISDFIERTLAPGVVPPAHVGGIATAMRAALENQREELIRMRMLSEDVRERWGDEYIARYYAKHVIDKPWDKVIRAAHKKIDGSHLRGRGLFETVKRAEIPKWEALGWEVRNDNDGDKVVMWRDFTEAEREKMGEIRDGVYRFVRGFLESSRDIATGHLFEKMAQASYTQDSDPGTGDYVEVPKTVVGGMTKGMTWQMKRNPQGQFAPRVAYRFGKLAGKWIPRDVWEQLAPLFEPRNELVNAYLKALSVWKEGKTVLNPVVHSNNVVSNVVSAYWALGPNGLSPETYRATFEDYKAKGRYYTEATDNGLFGTEYYSAEVAALMPQLEAQSSLPTAAAGKVSRLVEYLNGKLKLGAARRAMQHAYEAEDQFFKLMLYREARLNGATPEEAIDFAEQYIFNYADVPKGVRVLRATTHPFFAYTYKAVPMVLRTLLMHPERMVATFALFAGVNWLSFALLGDDGDEDEERKVMPDYMRGNTAVGSPKNIRMPLNFEDGAAMYMDVSRRLPLGDLYDVTNQSGGLALPAPLMPNNPAFTLAVGILANKDMFTGDEIVPEYDQDFPADKYGALGGYLARQLMPNNPLIPGSYSWNKIMNGIAGSMGEEVAGYTGLDYRGRTQTLPRAVLDTVLGIKLRSVDVDTERQKRMNNQARLARDVKSDMRRVARDKSLTDEQREARVQELTEKVRRIMDKAQEYRE